MRTVLIVIALVVIARVFVLVVLEPQLESLAELRSSEATSGPWFEVRVVKPLSARPLMGLLPDGVFGLPSSELRFDQDSPGATVGSLEPRRIAFSADGWQFVLALDVDGRLSPETRVVFPIELANKLLNLRCRPDGQAISSISLSTHEGSDELDGSFLLECASCEIAETGKAIEWPSTPLTIRGSFGSLQRPATPQTSGSDSGDPESR